MNYIEPIQKELEENLHKFSQAFMLRRKGLSNETTETPRYFNLKEIDPINKTLKIGSTQQGYLFFIINYENKIEDYIDTNDFWQQFKEFRTNFLLENYPTIDTQ